MQILLFTRIKLPSKKKTWSIFLFLIEKSKHNKLDYFDFCFQVRAHIEIEHYMLDIITWIALKYQAVF